ncbi:hypothetical protein ABZ923_29195 [Streptomyces sp. NPDC046881]|uniref:hypothetical protein n=1 Tax=Streptomyces sp. NPDC046881 TaxID=3155374 RepID=UPI00340A932C
MLEGRCADASTPAKRVWAMLLWAIIIIGFIDIVVIILSHLFDVTPGLMQKAAKAYKSVRDCWRSIKGEKRCGCGSRKDIGKGSDPGS